MGAAQTVLYQILIMFIIFGIGMICFKTGYIKKNGIDALSTLELDIVNPMLIFMSYQTDFNKNLAVGLGWAFLLSVISLGIALFLSTILVPKSSKQCALERFSALYSNCGFMGTPLINGLFGSEGVFYLAAYVTLFNILVWTHGVMVMNKTAKKDENKAALLKALRSPAIIAVALGLICFFLQIRLPGFACKSLNYIADMNTPLAMLIAGATAAQTNILKAALKKEVWRVTALKLLIIPLAVFAVLQFFPAPELVILTVTIAGACPVATTTVMFAIRFGKDSSCAAEFFTFTTVLSALTLPLVAIVAQYVL